jgi:ATP-dependent exoDNAse (exonuclease V) beta subunit
LEPPFIELHLAAGTKRDGALDRAAMALAFRLLELLDSSSLTADDIAILCRSSSSFIAYENALEHAGLPFLTVAGRGFYQRPEIRDVLNALQAVTDPGDDLALAGLLRSPVIGVSDAALFWLAQHRADGRPSLWSVLHNLPDSLSDEDRGRSVRAVELINNLRHVAGRTAIADLLKEFLDATNYRASLIHSGQHRAARNVSKLLVDAHTSGLVNTSEFLEYITVLRDSGTREGEARAIEAGTIKIMSIHAAKGLEFPLVAIGDVSYQGPGRTGPITSSLLGPILPLKDEERNDPAIYKLGSWLESTQEEAESRRLLYVAATRARDKLIINGTVTVQKSGKLSRLRGWLELLASSLNMADLDTGIDPDGNRAVPLDLPRGRAIIYEPGWTWQKPLRKPNIKPGQSSTPDRSMLNPLDEGSPTCEPDLPPRVWQVVPTAERPRAPAWVIGALVHEALAQWRRPDATFEDWATNRARNFGLTDLRQLANAASRSKRLLTRFQTSSLYQLMTNADQRLHEVPYHFTIEDEIKSGYIDALCRHNDQWTIIEFKTDEIRDDDAFDHLTRKHKYLDQLQQYHAAVEHLLNIRPDVFLCMLDYCGLVRSFPLAQLLRPKDEAL